MMKTILIVDDHAIVREPLARLLRLEGYRTLCAANGVEALHILECDAVDLMLLDLLMPKKDGIALLEHIRADARWMTLKVIPVTAVIEGSVLVRARELCADVEIPKSRFTIDELLSRVQEKLQQPDQRAA